MRTQNKKHGASNKKTKAAKAASRKAFLEKNIPLDTNTEVNDRLPIHGDVEYSPAREAQSLPIKTIPAHVQIDGDDENSLDAGYMREAAEDIDVDLDEAGNPRKRGVPPHFGLLPD